MNATTGTDSSTGDPASRTDTAHRTDTAYRMEHDSLGEIRVPVDARWQAQTQRAVENFPISGVREIGRAHV